jgi:hypothetical protein
LGPWAFREVFYPSSGPGGYLSPTVPYVKGSTREDQAPRSSNSVESREPSPHVSGVPLLAPLECSPLSLKVA